MSHWLYVFAGFPGKQKKHYQGLNAGGLQHCIENVEELAMLEYDPTIRLGKEGVMLGSDAGEECLGDFQVVMSPMLEQDGITWDWFPEKWSFGNGVTVHKTTAGPKYKTVVHGTDLDLDEFLAEYGSTQLAKLEVKRMHIRHGGWNKYEARWLPGMCPQEHHVVHLTWLVATHKLPAFAYKRIQDVIENGAEPKDLHRYDTDKHFSQIRQYDGKPAFACIT